jgi:hypothetical protein
MDEIGKAYIPYTLLALQHAEHSVWKLEASTRIGEISFVLVPYNVMVSESKHMVVTASM